MPGAAGSNGIIDMSIARRDAQAGWSSETAIVPYGNAAGSATTEGYVQDLAPDLSRGIIEIPEGPLSEVAPYDPNAPVDCSIEGMIGFCQNKYVLDYGVDETRLLTPMPSSGSPVLRGAGSSDYGHYVYSSFRPQLAGANENQTYEYVVETNTLRLVGLGADGNQLPSTGHIRIAGYSSSNNYLRTRPVSADGDRIYFEYYQLHELRSRMRATSCFTLSAVPCSRWSDRPSSASGSTRSRGI